MVRTVSQNAKEFKVVIESENEGLIEVRAPQKTQYGFSSARDRTPIDLVPPAKENNGPKSR